MNASDTLAYLDTTGTTITGFNSLPTPAAPTLNAINTIVAGAFPITYRVTINSSIGETAASNAFATSANKDRDNWSGAENIVINLPSIGSGQSYNIYCGVVNNFEFLIASNIASTATTFTDTGGSTMPQDTTRLYPTTNTTAGMRVARGVNIGGRAFLVGDVDTPYNVWNGGDPGHELDFSPANGGGISVVNSGGKELPIAVRLHRDGQGHSAIKVYCSGTKGKRFTLTPDQIIFGQAIITSYDVAEDEGESGTNSPDAILYYNNSNYYPSTAGFETDGTLPQLQNVLTTRKASNTIQKDISQLNQAAMDGACGFVFDGRLCFGLPVNASSNNEIWVLDIDRKGAWMKPWSVAASWMWQITDNTGNTHHLILSNNVIYDMTYAALTTDNGTAFLTAGQSGEVYFSDDKRMWVQLLQVIFVLAKPQGNIHFAVTGKTEDEPFQTVGEPTTFVSETNTTVAGWGEVNKQILGWGRNRWSKVHLVPTNSSGATQECIIEIDETVQWASYSWGTSTTGVDYNLLDVVFEYIDVGILDLS